jgi:hypothetical protein
MVAATESAVAVYCAGEALEAVGSIDGTTTRASSASAAHGSPGAPGFSVAGAAAPEPHR